MHAYLQQPFASLTDARAWVANFVRWCEEHYRHGAIGFVTPGQGH